MYDSEIDIGKHIKFYRELKHMSQSQLAEKLGVSQRNVSYYESGERIPPADVLKKIAILFNLSVDVMLGLKKTGTGTNDCYNYFYEEGDANWNIRKISENKGITYDVLLEKSCIEKTRLDSLWFGTAQPIAEELIRISNVLDVSIDYILDNSKRERLTTEDELVLRHYHRDPENIMLLLESFEHLNKRERTIVVGKCLDLERESSVAAEMPLKEAK